jgi:hypothetical protein
MSHDASYPVTGDGDVSQPASTGNGLPSGWTTPSLAVVDTLICCAPTIVAKAIAGSDRFPVDLLINAGTVDVSSSAEEVIAALPQVPTADVEGATFMASNDADRDLPILTISNG